MGRDRCPSQGPELGDGTPVAGHRHSLTGRDAVDHLPVWLTCVSQGTALLILFVVVPVVAAVAVIAFVQWRSPTMPAGYLTSELLRHGTPAQATLLDWKTPGQSFLDLRPMVTLRVAIDDDEPSELTITQSLPRGVLHRMKPGMRLDVRLSKDGLAGAVVLELDDR